jgi:3-deoxy-D-manno-octulosonic-acid transferase
LTIILYNLFLWLYRIGIQLVSPWNKKASHWITGRKGLFKTIETAGIKGTKRVWMHCASLGEFEQGRPVVESLRKSYPDLTLIISFFSPSGFEIRKNYTGAEHVFYLPMDSASHAKRFLDLVNPNLVLWIKYDYWYYYLRELQKRKIPVLLISPVFRADQPFFKWYGNIHRLMLDSFHAFFVQNENSQELLKSIGITQSVYVSGDTRFDRVADIAADFEPLPAVEAFCSNNRVIVAGSTWEEDEEELDHYANSHPDIKFIIAPHEISEDNLRDIESIYKNTIRYSDWERMHQDMITSHSLTRVNANVLIIDNIGMLSRLYYYGGICYVGGGFGDDGVHNVLEAAVYGRPVITGPVIEKYIEVMELAENGGVIIIDNALEAEAVFNRLFENPEEYRYHGEAARAYVNAHRGATEKILRYIQENRLLTS